MIIGFWGPNRQAVPTIAVGSIILPGGPPVLRIGSESVALEQGILIFSCLTFAAMAPIDYGQRWHQVCVGILVS
jgi:hypothetical protein